MSSSQLAARIAAHADDRKARDIVELDLRSVVDYTDFFVICSGGSDRQVRAIVEAIQLGCKAELGVVPQRIEGATQGQWVLMDYLDVIVHVFVPEVREYYALERLWGEVPSRAIEAAATVEAAVREAGAALATAGRAERAQERGPPRRAGRRLRRGGQGRRAIGPCRGRAPAPMAKLSIFSLRWARSDDLGHWMSRILRRVPVVVVLAVFAATPVFALAASPSYYVLGTPRRIAAAATRRRR